MDADNWKLSSVDVCYSADPESLSEAKWKCFGAMPGCAYAVTPKGADKLLSLFDELGNYDN